MQAPVITSDIETTEADTAPATKRYGARAYLNADGVIEVKQTIKLADDIGGQYAIDYDENGNQRQRQVRPGTDQDTQVGEAVRMALGGLLGPQVPAAK